jgi:RNA polymerase sigma-70 factor, ECF subfamily
VDEVTAIRAYQHGDPLAFEVLFELHAAHVYRTSYLIVRDAARADDVAQEAFLILAQRLPALAPLPLRSWLGRVAANLSLNDRRRARDVPLDTVPVAQQQALEWRDAVAGPDVVLETAEERARLRAAVAALAPRQRAMVVLRYYAECSIEEIAVALGCRPGTVRATLHQALRRLRERSVIARDGVTGEAALDIGTTDGGIAHDEE